MIVYANKIKIRHKNKAKYWQDPVYSWLIMKTLFGKS